MYVFIIKYLDGSVKHLVGRRFTYTNDVVNVIKYPVSIDNDDNSVNFWND